ncbi:MAG: SDR family NAD(P)-dependent oxidoreductase [Acidimicrobiales bacterium]
MEDLGGKVAVVTGAASGIGRALARRFASEGMGVVLADVERPALEAAASDLAEQPGGADVLAVPTDVSDGAQVAALAKTAGERFGAVDILCNNAGVSGAFGPIWTLSGDDWRWTLDVNLWGVIHGIRAFVPGMVERGEGHVVNTASLAGVITAPMMGPYSATKHAVVAISEVLAADLTMAGSGVGVSVLCPAWVNTNIADSARNRPERLGGGGEAANVDSETQTFARSLLASGLDPADIAEAVVAAVRANRFYVFTHPETAPAVRARFDAVIAGEGPPPMWLPV